MVSYTRTKTPVDLDRLIQEIEASAITIALNETGTSILGDQVTVSFKAALSNDEEAVFDGIISAHTGEPLPDEYVQTVALVGPTDSDDSIIVQPKTTKLGWHFSPRAMTFATATYQSLVCVKASGVAHDDVTVKFFGANDVLLAKGESETDQEFQTRLDTDCLATAVDFWPHFDIDLIAGGMKIKSVPTIDKFARGCVVVCPDIPGNQGGSVSFGSGGWDLSMFNEGEYFYINGRGAKRLLYVPDVLGGITNKIRTIVRHDVGVKSRLMMVFELFRP